MIEQPFVPTPRTKLWYQLQFLRRLERSGPGITRTAAARRSPASAKNRLKTRAKGRNRSAPWGGHSISGLASINTSIQQTIYDILCSGSMIPLSRVTRRPGVRLSRRDVEPEDLLSEMISKSLRMKQ